MSIISLLETSRHALSVYTQAIRTVGDNVANVNTEGYSRRRADLVTTGVVGPQSARTGTGVDIQSITRIVDQFLNSELVNRMSERARAEVRNEFMTRAERPFALDNQPGSLSYELNAFFGSLQDLTANPADIPLRTQVLESGGKLAEAIRQSYAEIAQLQREADNRLNVLVGEVNRLTGTIADLNYQITTNEYSANQEALTLRDAREIALRELGELISFKTVEDANGHVMVYLQNGFALVSGIDNRELEFNTDPSFAPAAGFPQAMDGGLLGSIVYAYPGGAEDLDLTEFLANGGGEVAGLLSLRGVNSTAAGQTTFDADGDLVRIGARIEALARDLLVRFNTEYLGPDEDSTTAGFQPSARNLDGNAPDAFGLFSFAEADTGNNFGDINSDGLPTTADLTALVAAGVFSFARNINFRPSTEREIAAARDIDPTDGTVSWAPGDASNIEALLTQRDALFSYATYNVGEVSETAKIDDFLNVTYSTVGSISRRTQDDHKFYAAREEQVAELQSNVSGVNLDEELSKLISFQRGYQAAARLIGIADELIADLLGTVG
ncbi:MAG TPA: flagellar hook-associated protein FlgK [Oligoflexia bacterium]|mgnify:CR=1 FL=1|nr:flagellar hook-associated protein FlgK [Oligoflexia bacterium]